jgi:predicted CXXCH cytochrome family protein
MIAMGVAVSLVGAFACRAQEQCRACHPREVAAFGASPMGTSIGKPNVAIIGRLHHQASNSTVVIRRRGPEMEHRVEHRGVSASYRVAYSVGAGLVGHSYLVRIGNYLFQSPVSFYTQTHSWDVTPGYEGKKHLDFTRQISSECLFCHTGSLHLVAGTTNQFEDPAFTAISCERCHGPSGQHLTKPVPGSIVNPAKLPARERDSVCEQCHLEGVARILNPGRDWWDYKPGDPLEKIFVTYLEASTGSAVRAVSHSEQLAQSRCARASGGQLWCGTCHSPHGSRIDRAAQVRQACLSCHQSLFDGAKHAPADECVTCHMPHLRPVDVAHSAVSDHRIVRRPTLQLATTPGAKVALRPWREPDSAVAQRDLGLAYFEWTGDHADPDKLAHAYELLSSLPPGARDPKVLADLASILLQHGQHGLAVQLFSKAAHAEPTNARYAYCLGEAQERAGNLFGAIEELRRSIRLDPSQLDAYVSLAHVYELMGAQSQKEQVIREYLRFMPQNIRLRSSD